MMAFCFIYYSGKRIKLRTFIVFGSLVILLIIGIQSLRATQLVQAYVVLDSKMKFSHRYSEFAIPYMYIAMNLENFVKYYSEIVAHSYGSFTFEFLTNGIGVSSLIADYFNFDKFRLHIGGYNTFPFYWPYYYDFGITGLALIPFIIGFIISNIYYNLHRNPNMVTLTLYAVAFAVIVISYTSDPLTRLDMMLNFVVIVVAQFFIINNRNQQNSKHLNANT
jgi:oligosaccharide repeat unit polymerase